MKLWCCSGELRPCGEPRSCCQCPLLSLSSLFLLLLQSGGDIPAPGAPSDPQQLPQTPVPTLSFTAPGNLSCQGHCQAAKLAAQGNVYFLQIAPTAACVQLNEPFEL